MKDSIVKYLAVGLILSPLTSTSLVTANELGVSGLDEGRVFEATGRVGRQVADLQETDFTPIAGKWTVNGLQENTIHEYTSEPDLTTGQMILGGISAAGKKVANGYCAVEEYADWAYNFYKGITPELTDEQAAAIGGVATKQYQADAKSFEYWTSVGRWGFRLAAGGMAVARTAVSVTDYANQQAFELCYAGCTKYAGMSPYAALGVATVVQHGAKAYSGTAVNSLIWGAAAYAPEIAYHTFKAPRYTYETGKFVVTKPVEAATYVVDTVKAVPGKVGAAATYAVDTAVAVKAKAVATKEAAAPYVEKAAEVAATVASTVSSVASSAFSAIKSGWSYFTSAPAA